MNLYNGTQQEINFDRRKTYSNQLPNDHDALKAYFEKHLFRLSTETRLFIMQTLRSMRKQIPPSGESAFSPSLILAGTICCDGP